MNVLKSSKTLMISAGLLLASLLAACGGGDQGRDPILGVPAATLLSVTVTPATASILTGGTQQLAATANYSDGSTRNVTNVSAWTSATPASVRVTYLTGLATGLAAGSSVVSAAFDGKSGAATVSVSAPPPPTLTAIALTPATATIGTGASQQYVVTGTYSNASSAPITTGVSWSTANNLVATISGSGNALGVAVGSTTITATVGSLTRNAALTVTAPATLTSIALTPANATIGVGGAQQYVVTGTFSNATTATISSGITWGSASTAIATINNSGSALGVAVGSSTISAMVGSVNTSAVLNVAAVAPPVVVIPPVVEIPPVGGGLDLGRAASFAVLAGTALTNNSGGTTLITGDVGSPSQTTDPTQAAGFANYKSGAILEGALADLQVAISNANNRSCTVSSASGIDLGGLVLTPGVYCYAGEISITGTFTMNGPGVYIFRTASTLNATANAIVALTGGATSENVFWVPVGPTTLGANGAFKGSILGQSAAITVGDNTTLLTGRVLSAAAVTLRNNKITK